MTKKKTEGARRAIPVPGFPERLEELKDKLKLQNSDLAGSGGLGPQSITDTFSGKSFPRITTLAGWKRAYGVNLNWLVDGDGPMFLGQAEELPASATPDERKMHTWVKMMRELGATKEEIRAGLTNMVGPARPAGGTRFDTYGASESPPRETTRMVNVHEGMGQRNRPIGTDAIDTEKE